MLYSNPIYTIGSFVKINDVFANLFQVVYDIVTKISTEYPKSHIFGWLSKQNTTLSQSSGGDEWLNAVKILMWKHETWYNC